MCPGKRSPIRTPPICFRVSTCCIPATLFSNGIYPFIDYSTGGDIESWIVGLKKVLELAGPKTQIIPGHGPMARRADVITFRDMLTQAADHRR